MGDTPWKTLVLAALLLTTRCPAPPKKTAAAATPTANRSASACSASCVWPGEQPSDVAPALGPRGHLAAGAALPRRPATTPESPRSEPPRSPPPYRRPTAEPPPRPLSSPPRHRRRVSGLGLLAGRDRLQHRRRRHRHPASRSAEPSAATRALAFHFWVMAVGNPQTSGSTATTWAPLDKHHLDPLRHGPRVQHLLAAELVLLGHPPSLTRLHIDANRQQQRLLRRHQLGLRRAPRGRQGVVGWATSGGLGAAGAVHLQQQTPTRVATRRR